MVETLETNKKSHIFYYKFNIIYIFLYKNDIKVILENYLKGLDEIYHIVTPLTL